ncbi:MAG: DNA polymerase III subunit [Clostridia bacterium]|nr:DNA polymerase III subunit [Clostridia bacterium]
MIEIIGHKKQIEQLNQVIKNQKLSHAYIFEGQSGIGKFLVAKQIAAEILKVNDLENDAADINIIEPEDGLIKISKIRQLGEEIILKPTVSEKKVFIIRDGEMMNEAAQNALLKVLEEPPEYAVIIITTSSKEKLIRTIKSRCTSFKFLPLSNDEIRQFYKNEEIDENIINFSRGSIGKVEALKEKGYVQDIINIYESLKNKNLLQLNKAFLKLKDYKEDIQEILELIMLKYFDELKCDYQRRIKQIDIVEKCRQNLKKNANFDIALDNMMLELWKLEANQ